MCKGKEKKKRESNHKVDSQLQRKNVMVIRGKWVGQWPKWVMHIKKGTEWDEPQVLYVSDESRRDLHITLRSIIHFELTFQM